MSSSFSLTIRRSCSVFTAPFYQAYSNLNSAITGKKIQAIAQNALSVRPLHTTNLSILERVSACFTGLLLIIPIINIVVLALLKMTASHCLCPLQSSPPSTSEFLLGETEEEENEEKVLKPLTALDNKEPMQALKRLQTLQALIKSRPLNEFYEQFEIDPSILSFDLDSILRKYNDTAQTPQALLGLADWAGIEYSSRAHFEDFINKYPAQRNSLQSKEVRKNLCYFSQYFIEKRNEADGGISEEKLLKKQIKTFYEAMIDSNTACIDQTLSQMQTLLLDIIAENSVKETEKKSDERKLFQARFKNAVGVALCKYRSALVKEIVAKDNPDLTLEDRKHIADLERMVISDIATALGMQGSIFSVQSNYEVEHLFSGGKAQVQRLIAQACTTFWDQYNPLKYLVEDLHSKLPIHRSFCNQIGLVQCQIYALGKCTETSEADVLRLDEQFAQNPDEPISQGGQLNLAAAFFYLEDWGLIQQKNK